MSSTIRQVSEANSSQAAGQPEQPRVYVSQQQPGSSPDLTTTNVNTYQTGRVMEDGRGSRRQWGPTQAPEDSPLDGDTVSSLSRKNKPRPFAHLLGRSRSTRNDLGGPLTPKTSLPNRFAEPDNAAPNDAYEDTYGMRTAPMGQERDRSFREMMSSTIRNRSADRQAVADSESGSIGSGKEFSSSRSNLGNSTSSGAFLTNLKNTSTKAADGIGKAGKGILGKITRSYSSGEKDGTPDENYVCKVITMNLVDQTRITRISKRLEDSKDKTEFWMPALPWRCIDYLNFKGCEEEGLYRIPGSGPRVREWQRRFDTELDIDLFEEPDLYDINIIGSMFKAWLRELPDEIFPRATQINIANKCAGAKETPQLLRDELSKLPPFNYYLLFAITCHLSLLHSYVDKNKMDYRNLCICFQPCMKIDGFCFQFLVCDWKNCWQGCWTEKEALVEEYRILDSQAASNTTNIQSSKSQLQLNLSNDRGLSSSGSDKLPATPRSPTKKVSPLDLRPNDDHVQRKGDSQNTRPESPQKEQAEPTTPKRSQQHIPTLSPVLPLSPLGI